MEKKLVSISLDIRNQKCNSVGIAPLRFNGNLHGDPQTKAFILNQQFSSLFTTEDTSNIPSLGSSTISSAPNIKVTDTCVLKLLQGLNSNKATGPDGISTRFLKEVVHSVTPSLTNIFLASIDQGQTPEDWKTANVSPIFKKGDKSRPTIYRPASLPLGAVR